jgi:tetratricopeptide (TPR) repeat protein
VRLAAAALCLVAAPAMAFEDAETSYHRAMDLARARRWEEARGAFRSGARAYPRDKRFPLELAGIAFKLGQPGSAKRFLAAALALDPQDRYARDFLATLFLLDGNLDAALKHWNRIGKPRIQEVRILPAPRLDAELLDRALLFSPAATLHWHELHGSRARLDQLAVFPRYRFELAARHDDSFALDLVASERNGWGGGTAPALLSLLRGVFFQSIYPEYFNWGRRAVNLETMLRWDPQKGRAVLSISAPVAGDPGRRARLYFDGRRENWNLSRTFRGAGPVVDGLALRRAAAGAELRTVVSGKWSWWTGLDLSWRSLPNRGRFGLDGSPVFEEGFSPAARAGTSYELLRVPERRLAVSAESSVELGKLLGRGGAPFARLRASLEGRWLPQARGGDYGMAAAFATGKLFGDAPFDRLFMLGLERDNDLWLRGHVGTAGGRKGNAPLGREFLLASWEMDKLIYRGPLWTLAAGPLFDTGTIRDGRSGFGSPDWLADAGAQLKIRVLSGPAVIVSWGKDLRTGRNAFYVALQREFGPPVIQ